MRKVKYTGPIPELAGETAIVTEPASDDLLGPRFPTIKVQFDDTELVHPETGACLGYGWHAFLEEDFRYV